MDALKANDELLVDYIDQLSRFIQFKTISADPKMKNEMADCVIELARLFAQNGFHAEIVNRYGNPVVLAQFNAGKEKTILIYGHYDVQPADVSEGRTSDPFVAHYDEKGQRFVGRGTNDMKGLLLIQMMAAFDLIKKGALGYNLTFIIEGDEESGGGNMRGFLEDHIDRLDCDLIMTSDGQGMIIDSSFRGTFNATVTARSKDGDQHSGIFGGALPSAGWEMIELAQRARALLKEDRDEYGNPLTLGCDEGDWKRSFHYRPNIEITGIAGGYTGDGYRNSVMGNSTVKFNVRLAPWQSAGECAFRFKEWLERQAEDLMPSFDREIEVTHGENGVLLWKDADIQHKIRNKVADIIGPPGLPLCPCGASIPVFSHFAELFDAPIISLSIGNEGANIHGADENITMECIERGLRIYLAIFSSE